MADSARVTGAATSDLWARLSPRTTWRLALGLLLVGGALGWMANWFPWASSGMVWVGNPALRTLAPLRAALIERYPLVAEPVLVVILLTYDAMGVVLAFLLISRHRPFMRATLLIVYALWLASLAASLLYISGALVTGHGAALMPSPSPDMPLADIPPVGAVTPAFGLWLGWLTIPLGAASLVLARSAERRGLPAEALGAPAARTRLELASAGLATLGVIIWEVGFFALPWVTQGCSGIHFSLNHYLIGTCSAWDSADMLARWSAAYETAQQIGAGASSIGLFAAVARVLTDLTLISMLVSLVTLWAVTRLWVGSRGAGRYGWLVACLAISGAIALAAWQASAGALTRSASLATAPPVYGPGVLVTFAGMTLAALGLVGVLTSRWRARHER
ncbi:MAG TPA: hypothetical protein VFN78_14635 [Ktedonobacterales bacterium]|nr:hypothetical protein [Ktedonobacterales bacterium]